jgi:hypothetical protein
MIGVNIRERLRRETFEAFELFVIRANSGARICSPGASPHRQAPPGRVADSTTSALSIRHRRRH